MASLKRWIGAAVVACVLVGLAYLPPHGAKSSGHSTFFSQPPRGTPARLRAQSLADAWRATEASLRLLTARRDLRQRVHGINAAGQSLRVMSESAGVMMPPPTLVDSAAHLAWRQLGLGETKVSVALITRLRPLVTRDGPVPQEDVSSYLAPDSTDRTTCVAVVPAGLYWSRYVAGEVRGRQGASFEDFVQWVKAGLGPCAFYAAFGTPSRPVRAWLAARNWDLALTLEGGPPDRQGLWFASDPRYPWYWDAIYSLPPTAVGCLAARSDACRAAVLAGASDDQSFPVPDIVRIERRWWDRVPRLAAGQRLLGDIATSIGRERFLTFWTSTQPVDTALALALKRPVGDWTTDWQRDFVDPIRLGPMMPLGGLAIACAIAGLALAIVVISASRRQVR
ncbi:MAG TPA: hypothetical protein VL549_00870 [Gemmatimonadales bacterium]|nr:hypothetical protein [Gemmatimonadales bacterium]